MPSRTCSCRGGAAIAAGNDIKKYNDRIKALLGDQANLFAATGKLVGQGYSVQQSFALLELGRVKASDSLAVMNQKVANLILGYRTLSGPAGSWKARSTPG